MTTKIKLKYGRHAQRIKEFFDVLEYWDMLGEYPKMEYEMRLALEQAKKRYETELEGPEKEEEEFYV